jgi:hypothetical protein
MEVAILDFSVITSSRTSSGCKKWHHVGYHTTLQEPICGKDMLLLTSTFNGTTMKIMDFCNVSHPMTKPGLRFTKLN